MRHIGHIIIAVYAGLVMGLQYFPAMASSQGIKESGPWLIAMLVAFLFVLAAAFKLFRSTIESWSSDDVSMSEFDFPDIWLFGLFTAFVVVNLIAHGILAALSDVGGSLWFGSWFLSDVVLALVSFVIFKVTAKAKLRGTGPRAVRGRDAA